MQLLIMKYAYMAMVALFTGLFFWNMFTAKTKSAQIGCAIALIPMVLRLLLIR